MPEETGVGLTLDEMAELVKPTPPVAPPPKLEEMKLDGESVPEPLRGKSAAELLARQQALEDALRLSEEGRRNAETQAQLALRTPPTVAAPVEEREPSDDEIAKIYEDEPLRAVDMLQQRAIKRAERNLEQRLGPLFAGSANGAESAARNKYPEEFEAFGKEINDLASSIPNGRVALSNPQAWDDLIAIVRGRNLDRIIELRTAKQAAQRRTEAQKQEVANVGFSGTDALRARPIATTVEQLDPIAREIADKLGMSLEDYVKWSRI